MGSFRVELGPNSHDVHVGSGLLDRLGELARAAGLKPGRTALVTDSNVARLFGSCAKNSLADAGFEVALIEVPAGEESKSLAALETVYDRLVEAELERSSPLFALGGGVVGDLAGFAAATYLRGLPLVQIPTTILAQVDSALGGKTAVNHRAGKNLIGAFYQPRLVLADTDVLDTLPKRELLAGYAEVAKYGLIDAPEFFAWCENNGAAVLSGDAAKRTYAIEQSCLAKARIVAADERETTDLRALLNLGHTFAHALEAETGFGPDLLHGEAVGAGMAMAFDLSARLGLCPAADAGRVRRHFGAVGLPVRLRSIGGDNRRNWDAARLIDHMRGDKKAEGGKLAFILARGIGKTFVSREVDEKALRGLLDDAITA